MKAPASIVILMFTLAGGCAKPAGEPAQLRVFAAASMQNCCKDLAGKFESSHGGIKVNFQFAGSQVLAGQIENGAPCDLFISADEAQMERLLRGGHLGGAPVVFAKNALAIIVQKGNPHKITNLSDLASEKLLVGLCAAEVPAGKYAKQILEAAKVSVNAKTLEANVRALAQKVASGDLDAAIGYITDVAASPEKLEIVMIPSDQNVVARYPVAMTKTAAVAPAQSAVAKEWLTFVASPAGMAIIQKNGFQPPLP